MQDIWQTFLEILQAVDILIALVTGAGVSAAVLQVMRTRRHRRLWRLSRPIDLTICVATSTATKTDRYTRLATGIGQVRALAEIAHSLKTAYGEAADPCLHMSQGMPPEALRKDIIFLGGPKNNAASSRFIEATHKQTGVVFDSEDQNLIVIDDKPYPAQASSGEVQRDYALIIATDNPFCAGKRALFFAGSHTYGTGAAGRLIREHLIRNFFWLPARFVLLAEITVDQHLDLTLRPVLMKTLEKAQ